MKPGGRRVSVGTAPVYRANYQPPKRPLHVGNIWRPFLVIVGIIAVLYGVLFSPLFRVRSIAVEGNTKLSVDQVRQQVNIILKSSFLGDNALFINTTELGRELKARNYQIDQVMVDRSLLGGLRIRLREQQATLQWRSGSSVFVLSGNGVAYAELKNLDSKLPLVEDSTNLPVKIGQKIVPSSFVKFATNLKPQLQAVGLAAKSVSVSETTTEVSVVTNKGFTIKLDTTRSLESQMGDYQAVVAKKLVPKEYIDLRIAGRVFYK